MDIPVKVINLARSTARREAFRRDNRHLAYEFFEGVDGRALTEAQLDQSGLFIPPLQFPSMGAYGAALSHLKLWDWAIEHDSAVTVVEDDAVFREDFAQASGEFLEQLRDDWDFVLWGWNFDSVLSVKGLGAVSPTVMLFDQEQMRANLDAFRTMRRPPDVMGLDMCFGIPAYTISAAGARRFKEKCFPMRHFELAIPVLGRKWPNTGIDIAMSRIYSGTHSFVAYPPLVATRNEHAVSTIQA